MELGRALSGLFCLDNVWAEVWKNQSSEYLGEESIPGRSNLDEVVSSRTEKKKASMAGTEQEEIKWRKNKNKFLSKVTAVWTGNLCSFT